MKKLIITSALFVALNTTGFASDLPKFTPPEKMPAGEYKNDIDHTNVHWIFNHQKLTKTKGAFRKVSATLNYDPKDPTKSSVTVKIDASSVVSLSDKFNGLMINDEKWFQPDNYPEITFVSTKIKKTGKNKGILYGDLSLKGVTKPVMLNATFNGAYIEKPFAKIPVLGFSATGTIKRSDWNLGAFGVVVPDEIDLEINIEFQQEKK